MRDYDGPSDVNANVVLDHDFPPLPFPDLAVEGHTPLIAKTDSNDLQALDPITLEPLKAFKYSSFLPELTGPLSGSHGAKVNSTYYNYPLDFGPTPTYKLFALGTDKNARVLANITDAPPAYIHSICATENYVLFTAWQADFSFYGLATLWNRNILDGLAPWDTQRSTLHYVIDRHTGEVAGRFTSAPMFAFHYINAYEEDREDGGKDVVVEMSTYADNSFLAAAKVEQMRDFKRDEVGLPRYHRFGLCLDRESEAIVEMEPRSDINIELAYVNPLFRQRRSRYIYGAHHTRSPETNDTFLDSIIKIDRDHPSFRAGYDMDRLIVEGAVRIWEEDGVVPGEPVFVPSPESRADEPLTEEDGVLLIVVLDVRKQASELIVL